MTDRELLQQVLDAWQDHWVDDNQSALLETIRANCAKEIHNCARCSEREWQGLTEEDKIEIQLLKWWDFEDTFDLDGYTRAIEAKLKEKNSDRQNPRGA